MENHIIEWKPLIYSIKDIFDKKADNSHRLYIKHNYRENDIAGNMKEDWSDDIILNRKGWFKPEITFMSLSFYDIVSRT